MLCVNWQFWLEKYFLHNLSLRWVARSISYVRSTPSTMHYEGAAVCVCVGSVCFTNNMLNWETIE